MAWSPVQGGNILSQYDMGGVLRYQYDDRKAKVFNYLYLNGSLLATRETPLGTSNHTVTYQHTDALGSPVAVTNQAGQVIDRTQWEPYGAAIGKPAYDGIGYTGHAMDGVTGLTYMQQRYYDPGIGRFLSVDPVTADGNTGGNFNRYWYANNNPYRFLDPDGRAARSICDKTPGRCDAVILVNPTSAQRTAMASVPFRKVRTGASGVENKFYMDDAGNVLGKDQSHCTGDDRCVFDPKENPIGTTLLGHVHVYPAGYRLQRPEKLKRGFVGKNDASPLEQGFVSGIIMSSGERFIISGSYGAPRLEYLGGGDAKFGAFVQSHWHPGITREEVDAVVGSFLELEKPK